VSWTVLDSPIDELRLVAHDAALTMIEFAPFPVTGPDVPADGLDRGERDDDDPVLVEAAAQLRAYFAGDLEEFDLPLAPRGTPFQQTVWTALCGIGFGETASYGELARRIGKTPAASRAVGLANGRNPIPVVIPCHRVIGANGTLTGYAGGLQRKQTLLDLETRSVLF